MRIRRNARRFSNACSRQSNRLLCGTRTRANTHTHLETRPARCRRAPVSGSRSAQLAVWSQRPRARRLRSFFVLRTFAAHTAVQSSLQPALPWTMGVRMPATINNSLCFSTLSLSLFSLSVRLSLGFSLCLSRARPDHSISSWFTRPPWPWPLQRVPERVVLPTL